jgi:hypothetical protein
MNILHVFVFHGQYEDPRDVLQQQLNKFTWFFSLVMDSPRD